MTTHDLNIQRIRSASKAIALTEYMNATELYLPSSPDEVSLLFQNPDELEEFRLWAVDQGLENFARVDKDVAVCIGAEWWNPEDDPLTETTPPVRPVEAFAVRFEFLRIPWASWRIEAMCVLAGDAPLHKAWLERFGSGCVVHVSYKLPSREVYQAHTRQGLYVSQWPTQPTFRAAYANSYGRFAYYQHPMFADGPETVAWLLKPRVNERDAPLIASDNLDV